MVESTYQLSRTPTIFLAFGLLNLTIYSFCDIKHSAPFIIIMCLSCGPLLTYIFQCFVEYKNGFKEGMKEAHIDQTLKDTVNV